MLTENQAKILFGELVVLFIIIFIFVMISPGQSTPETFVILPIVAIFLFALVINWGKRSRREIA